MSNNPWPRRYPRSQEETKKPAGDEKETPKLTVESIDNHVYFYAVVDADRSLALMRAIREIDGKLENEYGSRNLPADFPRTPIWLHIHSYGGELFAGLGVADQLQGIRTPIYSIVEGCAASASTLIAMACTRRYITPTAFILIHQLSSFMWGTYEQIRDDVHMLDMAMDSLTSFYAGRSKIPRAEVAELLKHDTWFNAAQAVERGLVDEIWSPK